MVDSERYFNIIDIGYCVFSFKSINGCSIILQQSISVRMIKDDTPGLACGNTIFQKIFHSLAPSILAASIDPEGIVFINWYKRNVPKGEPVQNKIKGKREPIRSNLLKKIKNGIIEEALIETIGCSGMTHSAAMAGEILVGKTLLEALNTDLVCDAINTAMRELFLQIVYGRSQSAFSDGGLAIGAGLEDLGKGTRSQVGTIYSTREKGPRYLDLAEGYVVELGLDENDQIIGYKYVHIGKMMQYIKSGIPAIEAIEKASGTYGRFDEAVKKIDPRKE